MNLTNFTNSIAGKKVMAFAGLLWLVYIFFHAIVLLKFHQHNDELNSFYLFFKQSYSYLIMFVFLLILLFFHVFIAIYRQIKNNSAVGKISYYKTHPQSIPRLLVWLNIVFLLIFIVTHIYGYNSANISGDLIKILSQPLLALFYFLALIALSAHLYHALNNILQTFAVSAKQFKTLIMLILLILFTSFSSIIISVIL